MNLRVEAHITHRLEWDTFDGDPDYLTHCIGLYCKDCDVFLDIRPSDVTLNEVNGVSNGPDVRRWVA